MPSSISSSSEVEERLSPLQPHRLELGPARPDILRSVVAAFLLAIVLLAGLEGFLRHRGFRPSLADDKDLWCAERDRVPRLRPADVVLLGGSRMQLDFSLDAFRRRYPERHIVQLAIDGSTPFAALADLASNTQFAGTVLCDVHAYCLSQYGMPSDAQAQYVQHYARDWSPNRRANRALLAKLQQRLVIANPAAGLNELIKDLLARHLEPPFHHTGADRETFFDYALMPAELRREHEREWAGIVEEARREYDQRGRAAWEADADRVGTLVRRIQARGGQVFFARFPTSGAVRAQEDRLFPRRQFWDAFIQRTGAAGLNFADSPALARFHCAEGSHLDYRDAASFTAALWKEIDKLQAHSAVRRSPK